MRPAELRYLTAVDHYEHVALVAVDPASEEIRGSARYIRLPARPDDAELAIEVIDDWQRRGLGRALLRALSDHARTSGIRRLVAIVSAENFPMQRILEPAGTSPEVIDGELEYAIDPNALAGEQPPRASPAPDPSGPSTQPSRPERTARRSASILLRFSAVLHSGHVRRTTCDFAGLRGPPLCDRGHRFTVLPTQSSKWRSLEHGQCNSRDRGDGHGGPGDA